MMEIIYGRRPVLEALKAYRRKFQQLFFLQSIQSDKITAEIVSLAHKHQIEILYLPKDQLEIITGGGHHQGVAARVSLYSYVDIDGVLEEIDTDSSTLKPPVIVVLDHITDPQNFGAILRVAETGGVFCVVIPKDRSVEVTPAVVRSSSGASEYLRVTKVVNITRAINLLKKRGFWVVGLDSNDLSIPYERISFTYPVVLVIGQEGKGISRLVRENCDYLLHIPMYGSIDSMNVATALAVIVHEIRRQHRIAPGK